MSTELAVREGSQGAIETRDVFSTVPRTFDGMMAFCTMLSSSELVPKDFREKPANVMVALQMGAEIGLSPMQALQNIAVINGRPSLWGDAVLAVCQGSGKLEYIKEWHEGAVAHCEVKRRGYPSSKVTTFSQEDAAKMGLAGKAGPWTQAPQRMRQMRARAFALRDQFADVLKGVATAEEIIDITPIDVTPQAPEPPKPTTQEEKGASIREKMSKQLKKEPAPAASAIAAPTTPPVAAGAASPSIDDSAWADMKVMWEESHFDLFTQVKNEFQVPNSSALKPEHRAKFAARMRELTKGPQ